MGIVFTGSLHIPASDVLMIGLHGMLMIALDYRVEEHLKSGYVESL